MRCVALVVGALGLAVLVGNDAFAADSGPVIVVPGRPGRPVLLNGVDVTGAMIEGDFGLYSPHMVNPVVVPAPFFVPPPLYLGGYEQRRYDDGSYFPAFGRTPGYGRREIEPPADRPLPSPAQSYRRLWSIQSAPVPASTDPPTPLIVSPQVYPGRSGGKNQRQR